MRMQIKRSSEGAEKIRIISTSSIATTLDGLSLQFKDSRESVTVRGDDVLEVPQGELVNLTELFDNPVIEAGGTNQPGSKEVVIESGNTDGVVRLRKSDEIVDQVQF